MTEVQECGLSMMVQVESIFGVNAYSGLLCLVDNI